MSGTLMGMKIVAHPLIPDKLPYFRLNPDVPMSDEFRADMQAWCDDFFGFYTPLYIVDGAMLVPERVLAVIRCAVPAQGLES